jgi:hypothetical protein
LKELCTLLCQFLPWIAAKCNGVRDVNITRVVHMIEERLGISGRQHRD